MNMDYIHNVVILVFVWCLGVPAFVSADQHAPELPGLFEQLQVATDPNDVGLLENEIWQHWLEAPDAQAKELMSQISLAMSGGDLEVAIELCDELIGTHPDYAEAWNRRATLHYMLRNFPESVADIRETIALEPRHFGAISGLGLIFLKEGNLDAALEAFEQVLVISPGSISAMRSVEQVRKELGSEI